MAKQVGFKSRHHEEDVGHICSIFEHMKVHGLPVAFERRLDEHTFAVRRHRGLPWKVHFSGTGRVTLFEDGSEHDSFILGPWERALYGEDEYLQIQSKSLAGLAWVLASVMRILDGKEEQNLIAAYGIDEGGALVLTDIVIQ